KEGRFRAAFFMRAGFAARSGRSTFALSSVGPLACSICSELFSALPAGQGFALPGRGTFSLRAQRESNQRESAPRHPGLIALGRSDFPRSGAAPGAGRDGPSLARLCLARPSWPLTPLRNTSTRPPVGDPESELLAGLVVAAASA